MWSRCRSFPGGRTPRSLFFPETVSTPQSSQTFFPPYFSAFRFDLFLCAGGEVVCSPAFDEQRTNPFDSGRDQPAGALCDIAHLLLTVGGLQVDDDIGGNLRGNDNGRRFEDAAINTPTVRIRKPNRIVSNVRIAIPPLRILEILLPGVDGIDCGKPSGAAGVVPRAEVVQPRLPIPGASP